MYYMCEVVAWETNNGWHGRNEEWPSQARRFGSNYCDVVGTRSRRLNSTGASVYVPSTEYDNRQGLRRGAPIDKKGSPLSLHCLHVSQLLVEV